MIFADWLKLILLSFLWGGAFFFAEVALDHVEPLTIVMVRVSLAAIILIVFCRVTKIPSSPLGGPVLVSLLIMGILNNVIPFTLITYGQVQISGGLASILNATTPLFTVAVAHFWPQGEKATPLKIAGVVAGIAGVAVLMGVGNLAQSGGTLVGQLAVLGAAVSYAFALLYGRRFKSFHPIFFATGMLTAASLVMIPLAFIFETPLQPMPPAPALAAMAGLAIFASAIAYFLYFSVLQSAGPTNASLVTFMIPASAILLGVMFRNENLEPNHLAGLGLILLGLALVDGRLLRRRR